MDRTLITPAMIETFRSCKRAYWLAYSTMESGNLKPKASTICKRFVLKTVAAINREKIRTVHEVQKFAGQNWPLDKLNDGEGTRDVATRAFLFAYKVLANYLKRPYRPGSAEVVGVALRVRARVPQMRVYIEDTLDLVLWHPLEQRLELVDFHLQAIKTIDRSWPSEATLVKYFLAEKLRNRFPFKKLTLTSYRLTQQDNQVSSMVVDEGMCRLHWQELVKTLDEMKAFSPDSEISKSVIVAPHGPEAMHNINCAHCRTLEKSIAVEREHKCETVGEPELRFPLSA